MSIEQWLLTGTLICTFITAAPKLRGVLSGSLRWRIGAWSAAVYSYWFWNQRGRRYSPNPLLNRTIREVRKAAIWPIKSLSRLASSRLQVTFLLHRNSKLYEGQSWRSEREMEAIRLAVRLLVKRENLQVHRRHKRTHRGISCSTCGARPNKIHHLFCGAECSMAGDAHQAPHFCYEHRHTAFAPLEPNLAKEMAPEVPIGVKQQT